MAEELEARGHELLFVAGGGAGKLLASHGREVIDVPVYRHRMRSNRIRLWASLSRSVRQFLSTQGVVGELVARFSAFAPDLLITDFESYSVRAARRMGLPLMCFNHQQVLTHTRYEVPRRYAFDAWLARVVVNVITPRRTAHTLVSSFFYPPLRDPERSTLVAPILRRAVREVETRRGDKVLVYHNASEGVEALLDALAELREHSFIVYNFEPPADAGQRLPNVEFRESSVDGFLRDLAAAKAVISTAGFTLISEAIYLGKPMLVMPNQGIFEQTLNAIYLERDGLGEAVHDHIPTAEDIRGFLARLSDYEANGDGSQEHERRRCGNEAAAACIERVLDQVSRRSVPSVAELPAE